MEDNFMSILIKNIKAPSSCYSCPCVEHFNTTCKISNKVNIDRDDWYNERASNCPLIDIPDNNNFHDCNDCRFTFFEKPTFKEEDNID